MPFLVSVTLTQIDVLPNDTSYSYSVEHNVLVYP